MFTGDSLKDWLTGTGIVIVLLIAGLVAATQWKQGGIRRAAEIFGVALVVCLIVAIATHTKEIGSGLYSLFFG